MGDMSDIPPNQKRFSVYSFVWSL